MTIIVELRVELCIFYTIMEVAFLMDRMMIIVGTYIVQHASGYARLLAWIRSGAFVLPSDCGLVRVDIWATALQIFRVYCKCRHLDSQQISVHNVSVNIIIQKGRLKKKKAFHSHHLQTLFPDYLLQAARPSELGLGFEPRILPTGPSSKSKECWL